MTARRLRTVTEPDRGGDELHKQRAIYDKTLTLVLAALYATAGGMVEASEKD